MRCTGEIEKQTEKGMLYKINATNSIKSRRRRINNCKGERFVGLHNIYKLAGLRLSN